MFKKGFKAVIRTGALCCALFLCFSFTACKPADKGGVHTHEFTDAWVQGETGHWQQCTGCDETRGEEEHRYSDGACSVCQKPEPHTHDFSGAWVQGEARHWKECSGCNEIRDAADHEYENGVCICGKAEPHTHDFTGAWVQGETQHWKECECGQTQDEEAHEYENGVCKCGKQDPAPKYTFPESVNFGYDAAVHDPSVFKDPADNTYYVFGSHFAVASSTDLVHWTQRVYDGQYQKLYGNETYTKNGVTWPKALQSTLDRVNPSGGGDAINSTWAPDVEYHDGKYYMYYSLTKAFGSRESAIARVEADNVLGPYSNNVVLFDSMLGSGTAPNCIDPELFYDKEGGLWMVYGSFFGGIYIKELYNSGENWGLPKESGFGKLLWKGGSSGVEGPYIFHSGDYYYLMVSDGSLLTNYNMRIARSTNPDGPYYDISGADMAAAYGKGNKLAGNWKFEGEQGKAAYGHNSVCEIDGEFFVIGHMRYEDNGGVTLGHNVRVHRLLFNEQGWPVLASQRYAGETLGAIKESELVGSYDLILHSEGIPQKFVASERYRFTENHQIVKSGAQVGVWSYKASGNFVEITLDGVTYKGVAMPVWTSGGGTISLSAVSDTGRSLWANFAGKPTDPDLDIIRQISGAASNALVAAFDGGDGFTVSFRSTVTGTNTPDDWNAHAITSNGLCISLPNLSVAENNSAGIASGNIYPSKGGNYNTANGAWNSYLGATCFVTIVISKSDGIGFYKNGVCTQSYPVSAVMEEGLSVGTFVNALLEAVKTDGFTLAESGVTANDLIVSRGAADEAKALQIYNYYG